MNTLPNMRFFLYFYLGATRIGNGLTTSTLYAIIVAIYVTPLNHDN